MSGSESGLPFERIATVMRALAAANQAMGLVMFSDTAYELLPPNSPASALLAFECFFDPQAVGNSTPIFGLTPWNQFSAGTRISAGLCMGQEALRRAHVTHGSLLIISDLNDSSAHEEALVAEAFMLNKAYVPVRIVPVTVFRATSTFGSLFCYTFIPLSAYRTMANEQAEPIASSWPGR